MSKNKVYRIAGQKQPGPDYRCSNSLCKVWGVRLFRQTNTFEDHLKLLCAVCAEKDQVEQIKRYASFHRVTDASIGDLVAARPCEDGSGFWGHTSGDVGWWYELPQYTNPDLEIVVLRRERDHFRQMYEYEQIAYLKSRGINV